MTDFDDLEAAVETLELSCCHADILPTLREQADSPDQLADLCRRINAILNSSLVESWVMLLWPESER